MNIELEKVGLSRLENILTITNKFTTFNKENDKVTSVIDNILLKNQRSMPLVSNNNKLNGIVSVRDILDAFLINQNFNNPVSNIMTREIVSCNINDNIGLVLQKFKISKKGTLPIVDDGKFVNIVTERNYIKFFPNTNFNLKVKDIMTKKPFFIKPHMTILEAIKTVVNTKYRRLPIVEDKKLVGLIVAIDLLNYIKKANYNVNNLKHPVNSIMIDKIYSITENSDISEAIKLMRVKNIGGLLVVNEKQNLEGIITERDILEQIV